MIETIPWRRFLIYLFLSVGMYYFFAVLYFYKVELINLINNSRKKIKKDATPYPDIEKKSSKMVTLGESHDYGKDF